MRVFAELEGEIVDMQTKLALLVKLHIYNH